LRRLFRPRGCTAADLIPAQQLEDMPGEHPGTWKATGPDPQFLAACHLPAGWVRLRLQMTSSVPGNVELHVDNVCVFRADAREAQNVDCFLRLPRPIRAIRFVPLNGEGVFRLRSLQLEPVSPLLVPWHALRGKLATHRTWSHTVRSLGKALALLLSGQPRELLRRLRRGLRPPALQSAGAQNTNQAYQLWRRSRQLTGADRRRIRREIQAMIDPPRFSVLMPVYNVEAEYLRRAIESFRRQLYPHCELCIADDGSTAGHIRPLLEEYARRDPRIQVAFCGRNGGISAASNAALALATGDYIALLDNDDELAEHALFRMAQAIVADRSLDMLYSDEDKLDEDGQHVEPFFKPGWSPEYFLAGMYTCHLGVYRTDLVRAAGFRSAFDTAQDYDLALRLHARSARVGHVPDVLYHWRKTPTSTARSRDGKPHAHRVAERALNSFLTATGRPGRVEPGPRPGLHRVRYALGGTPQVSIIIPTGCRAGAGGRPYVLRCLESIRRRTTYSNYEIIIVHNTALPSEVAGKLERLRAAQIPWGEAGFNLSGMMNRGAEAAGGGQLLFLNDDTEVIAGGWLEALLEFSQQPEVGAVGAKLCYPDGRLQHAGIVLYDGDPRHCFRLFPGDHPGYFCGNLVHRNCSAVTGACLMTRADLFRAIGGFDLGFPVNYSDVDYCLKLRSRGLRIVWTPYAELYHHESVSKAGLFQHEQDAFLRRWRGQFARDPYYNPNLSTRDVDFRIGVEDLVT
jgi:GT2 family glycosyltransferase